MVVGGWRNEGSGDAQSIGPSSIYGSLEVFCVSILEGSTLTDLNCYRTEIRSKTV